MRKVYTRSSAVSARWPSIPAFFSISTAAQKYCRLHWTRAALGNRQTSMSVENQSVIVAADKSKMSGRILILQEYLAAIIWHFISTKVMLLFFPGLWLQGETFPSSQIADGGPPSSINYLTITSFESILAALSASDMSFGLNLCRLKLRMSAHVTHEMSMWAPSRLCRENRCKTVVSGCHLQCQFMVFGFFLRLVLATNITEEFKRLRKNRNE